MSYRPHRALAGFVLLLATLAVILGAGARWIDVQLLGTTHWTDTSSRLIANSDVRRAISGFAVRRAFGAAGIDGAIDHVLPGPLASHARGALHHAASGAAGAVLSSGPGRRSWRTANRQAESGLLEAVDHPGRHRGLVLNLSPLLRDIVGSVAGTSVARAIPGSAQLLTVRSPQAGRLVVLDPRQVDSLRTEVLAIRTLSWALPLIALALFGLVLLVASGWRTVALSAIGYRLLIAGGIVLGVRALLQYVLADAFVSSATDRAGVRAAWLIGSSTLRTEAIWLLVGGAVLAAGGWLLRLAAR